MDPIVTYQNTTHAVAIGFELEANQLTDTGCGVIDNVRRMNLLSQLVYPAYLNNDGTAVLKAPPFFRIKYGNYLGSFQPTGDLGANDGLTGYINSLTTGEITVVNNTAFGGEGSNPSRALPQKFSVKIAFDVIHDKRVGWYENSAGAEEFSPDSKKQKGYGTNFPFNAGSTMYPPSDSSNIFNFSDPDNINSTVAAAQTNKILGGKK